MSFPHWTHNRTYSQTHEYILNAVAAAAAAAAQSASNRKCVVWDIFTIDFKKIKIQHRTFLLELHTANGCCYSLSVHFYKNNSYFWKYILFTISENLEHLLFTMFQIFRPIGKFETLTFDNLRKVLTKLIFLWWFYDQCLLLIV